MVYVRSHTRRTRRGYVRVNSYKRKFEPIYYRKETAENRLREGFGNSVKKVRGNFIFKIKGRNVKRKTGWKLFGGTL